MILNRQRQVRVARQPLESFLRRVKQELGLAKSDVTVCLVSETEIARLNKRYRGKTGPTDVLSFPSVERKGPLRAPPRRVAPRWVGASLGDVAISPATARRYSKKNARTLASELRVLILHGVLHLLGFDHEKDQGEMDRVEQRLRGRLGLL